MTPIRAIMIGTLAWSLLGARSDRHPSPPPLLGLPLACTIGDDCAVQSYMNDDLHGGVSDYMCHGRTYAGHNGTDFRIQSLARMRAGVPVLASASGHVLRVRDGVPDVSVNERGMAAVRDEQCGNGVVMNNGHGFETQYCHLRNGSVRVRPGQTVKAGARLGLVGLSGNTEFPHVHLTVRHNGHIIDPFAYGAQPGSCGGGSSLWRDRISYQLGQPFVWGFASRAVSMSDVQASGSDQQPHATRYGPALVAFVQSIGLIKGDIQRLIITGPDGRVITDATQQPLDIDQAQFILDAGKRSPNGGWPAGVYQAEYTVRRDGIDVIARSFRVVL